MVTIKLGCKVGLVNASSVDSGEQMLHVHESRVCSVSKAMANLVSLAIEGFKELLVRKGKLLKAQQGYKVVAEHYTIACSVGLVSKKHQFEDVVSGQSIFKSRLVRALKGRADLARDHAKIKGGEGRFFRFVTDSECL
jgi:hypothetical protein